MNIAEWLLAALFNATFMCHIILYNMVMKKEIKKEIKKWKSFTIYGKVFVLLISFAATLIAVSMLMLATRISNSSWNIERPEYVVRY